MKPRPYQAKAVDHIRTELQDNRSTLVVMPTGTGKTVVFSLAIESLPGIRRAMVIAHREELIFQAAEKIKRVTGKEVCIEMGDLRAKDGGYGELFGVSPVVVSTIQTQTAGGQGGRMTRFDPQDFDLLIIDEAHHATASTYKRAMEWYKTNPDLKILGVTATPDRADEAALGQVFDTVAFDYEVPDAIDDGWLVPITQRFIEVEGLDFSSVKTTAGDLNGKQLAEIVEQEQNLHEMATPWLEISGSRRGLFFTPSVDSAERFAEILNRTKPGSASWICGKTDKEERRDRLAAFAKGHFQYMINVGCLTEGFDDPGVEIVGIGRATKSRALYAQMVGRGTRPLEGVVDGGDTPEERKMRIEFSMKPRVEVLDFVGNSGRHKLMSTADILGGEYSDEAVELATTNIRESGGEVDMRDALEQAELEIEKRRKEALEVEARKHVTAKAAYRSTEVNPFDVFDMKPNKARGWDRAKQLSQKQKDYLRKIGVDPEKHTYTEGKQILDEVSRRRDEGLCTYKQAKVLAKHGKPTDVTFEEASRIIDGLAATWRKR